MHRHVLSIHVNVINVYRDSLARSKMFNVSAYHLLLTFLT